MSQKRRVVVTGVGAVTPLGLSIQTSWEAAKSGKSGVDRIRLFDPELLNSQIAGEVKDFNPEEFIPKKDAKKMDRFIQLSLAATSQAWDHSGLGELSEDQQIRAGSLIGVGIGGLPAIESQRDLYLAKGPSRMGPFFIPQVIANMAPGHVSIKYKLRGPNFSITSACASGAHAIGEATRYIEDGIMDIMVAGGSEACVCEMACAGFAAMKALSRRNDDPQRASRPWDQDRDGFVIAEGAATLILEERESAIKRGANILAEVTGYGVSSDAYHMTNPSEGGIGASEAMAHALNHRGIKPEQIDYINAHGTSTGAGDVAETLAVKKIFGSDAERVWVSSTKSMTGHTLGAAGAIESAFCVMSIKDQIVPPTINLDQPSSDCDLDYVPNQARDGKLHSIMNNSFGFGGTNASLIFSKTDDN